MGAKQSILLQRADSVALCINELESVGHKTESIVITETYSLVRIAHRPNAKNLHGLYRGIVGDASGHFVLYQIKLQNVFVQWQVPFFDAKYSARTN